TGVQTCALPISERDRARHWCVNYPHPRAAARRSAGGARLSVSCRGAAGGRVGGGRQRGGGGGLLRGGARVGGVGFPGMGADVAGAWDCGHAPVHAVLTRSRPEDRSTADEPGKGPFRAQKRGPHGIVGALLFGIFSFRWGHTPTVGVGGAVTVGSCAPPPPQ